MTNITLPITHPGDVVITPDIARQIVALAASPTPATPPAEAQPRQPWDEEERPCGICGDLVTWAKTSSFGWQPIHYHDCKPVPGEKLDKALADLATVTAERDRLAELLDQAKGFLQVHGYALMMKDKINAALAELEKKP